MSRYTLEGQVPCRQCGEPFGAVVVVYYDPGCWRTSNGDGWPESTEYDPRHPEECAACQTPVDTEWVIDTLRQQEAR